MNSKEQQDRDLVYAEQREQIADFVFDQRVAAVFPDMINRSVPGYATIIGMIGLLAARHASAGSNLYDLGCSLGAACAAMATSLQNRDCQIIAVDNAPAMIERAADKLRSVAGLPVDLICADVQDVKIHKASVVVLNFTLQFLPRHERLQLLRYIRQGMLEGGVLILSEKIAGANAQEDALLMDLHHAFKQANGYSELEISQKRIALENVLLPETVAVHRERLQAAGFSRVDLWFQCFNFVSILARP
jgi:tRNA (cmo5U34)-methyltransferase